MKINERAFVVAARNTRSRGEFPDAVVLPARARKCAFHRIEFRAGAKAFFANVGTLRPPEFTFIYHVSKGEP